MGFNLLSDRKSPQAIYLISCTRRGDQWFFADLDDEINKVVWTAQPHKAQPFKTEEGVFDFKSAYLSDRLCNIVRIQ